MQTKTLSACFAVKQLVRSCVKLKLQTFGCCRLLSLSFFKSFLKCIEGNRCRFSSPCWMCNRITRVHFLFVAKLVGENKCFRKGTVAGDLWLYSLHFGSSGSVHDGNQQHIRLVCSVDSSVFAAEWHFSMVVEQVAIDDSGTVVAIGVVVGNDHTTVDQTTDLPVPSIVGCTAEVDTVGDVGIGGNRCSANVHHDSVVDRIVGSYLVPGHLFGSVYYAVECWSVDALWQDVLKVDLMALVVHGIAPLSAVPEVRVHVFPLVQLSQLFQAVWNVISHGDLDRVVGSQIVRLIQDDLARPPLGVSWSTCAWESLYSGGTASLLSSLSCLRSCFCSKISLLISSQRPRCRFSAVWVLCLLFFMALKEAMHRRGVWESQSESLRPKSYTKRCFGCSMSLRRISSEKNRLIRIVGISSRTILSNNGLFTIAQGYGKETITGGIGSTLQRLDIFACLCVAYDVAAMQASLEPRSGSEMN